MFIEHSKISSDKTVPTTKDYSVWISLQPLGILTLTLSLPRAIKTVPTTKDYSVWISLQPLGILTLTLSLPRAIKKNFFLTIRRDEKN